MATVLNEWQCEYCTLINQHEANICSACGNERPSASPLSEVPLELDTGHSADLRSGNAAWACPFCTYMNHGGFVCEACYESSCPPTDEMAALSIICAETDLSPVQQDEPFDREQLQNEGRDSEYRAEGTSRICTVCTYRNHGGSTCQVCKSPLSTLPAHSVGHAMGSSLSSLPSDWEVVASSEPAPQFGWRQDLLEEADYDARASVRGRELRLVMIGHTGSGKSATANTLLGTSHFRSGASAVGVTDKSERGRAQRFGRDVQIVDTPGLFDPCMTNEKIIKEITKCIAMTTPGPHAFILVVQIGRFTKEEHDTVMEFQKYFGREMMKYLIIAFTRIDDLEGKSLKEYTQRVPLNLAELLKASNYRYIGFNNKASQSEKTRQAEQLVRMIDKMVAQNGGSRYTNEMFREAEKAMKRQEQAVRRELEEKKRKEKEKMEWEFKRKLKDATKEHEEYVAQLQHRIGQLQSTPQGGDGNGDVTSEMRELKKQIEMMRKEKEEEDKRFLQERIRKVDDLELKYQCLEQETRETARTDVEQEGEGFGLAWKGVKNTVKGLFQGIKNLFS